MDLKLNEGVVVGRMVKKLMLLFISLVSVAAYGNQPFPNMPTAAEMATLPEYCRARIGQDGKLYEVWLKRMGHDKFLHVHHYCHGLVAMNRVSLVFEKRTRRDLLQKATQEFDYVIRNWPPDFYLTIDAKRRHSMAQLMLSGL